MEVDLVRFRYPGRNPQLVRVVRDLVHDPESFVRGMGDHNYVTALGQVGEGGQDQTGGAAFDVHRTLMTCTNRVVVAAPPCQEKSTRKSVLDSVRGCVVQSQLMSKTRSVYVGRDEDADRVVAASPTTANASTHPAFKIEDNIPLRRIQTRTPSITYPLNELKVGQSFTVTYGGKKLAVMERIRVQARRLEPKRFAIRSEKQTEIKTDGGTVRVWRVK